MSNMCGKCVCVCICLSVTLSVCDNSKRTVSFRVTKCTEPTPWLGFTRQCKQHYPDVWERCSSLTMALFTPMGHVEVIRLERFSLPASHCHTTTTTQPYSPSWNSGKNRNVVCYKMIEKHVLSVCSWDSLHFVSLCCQTPTSKMLLYWLMSAVCSLYMSACSPGKKGIILFLGSFCPPSTGNLSRICIWN